MPDKFFKLNAPFHTFDREQLIANLQTSKHIYSILYKSDALEDQRISGTTFENVSFSKTNIQRVTFSNCIFIDCLFIGTQITLVEFHDCTFKDCNFFKSKFTQVYAKPAQFRKAISDVQYANVAVHLYQQLRDNYYQESQRTFKNEAEYYFAHWERVNNRIQSKRKGMKWYQRLYVGSFLHEHLLGYGYRLRNLAITALVIIILAVIINHTFASSLFTTSINPSFITTIYFTITTMVTLGATGYSPNTEFGYVIVVINALFGITILSATISAIFKRIIR